jgi:hypothetical protein
VTGAIAGPHTDLVTSSGAVGANTQMTLTLPYPGTVPDAGVTVKGGVARPLPSGDGPEGAPSSCVLNSTGAQSGYAMR